MLPGRALDLACGTGRHALWLASHGWEVTAIDVSVPAIESLQAQAHEFGLTVDARVADLEKGEYTIEPARWNLIAACYYLQKDLFATIKQGVIPGGLAVAISLLVVPGKESSPFRLEPGRLRAYFADWEILHDREGSDSSRHAVAEIVARRPLNERS